MNTEAKFAVQYSRRRGTTIKRQRQVIGRNWTEFAVCFAKVLVRNKQFAPFH